MDPMVHIDMDNQLESLWELYMSGLDGANCDKYVCIYIIMCGMHH